MGAKDIANFLSLSVKIFNWKYSVGNVMHKLTSNDVNLYLLTQIDERQIDFMRHFSLSLTSIDVK